MTVNRPSSARTFAREREVPSEVPSSARTFACESEVLQGGRRFTVAVYITCYNLQRNILGASCEPPHMGAACRLSAHTALNDADLAGMPINHGPAVRPNPVPMSTKYTCRASSELSKCITQTEQQHLPLLLRKDMPLLLR